MAELTVTYQGHECFIRKDRYLNGRPAISLVDKHDGKRVAMATVDDHEIDTRFVLVKDFGHEQDPLHVLQEKGLIESIGDRITNGFLWLRQCELKF